MDPMKRLANLTPDVDDRGARIIWYLIAQSCELCKDFVPHVRPPRSSGFDSTFLHRSPDWDREDFGACDASGLWDILESLDEDGRLP